MDAAAAAFVEVADDLRGYATADTAPMRVGDGGKAAIIIDIIARPVELDDTQAAQVAGRAGETARVEDQGSEACAVERHDMARARDDAPLVDDLELARFKQ